MRYTFYKENERSNTSETFLNHENVTTITRLYLPFIVLTMVFGRNSCIELYNTTPFYHRTCCTHRHIYLSSFLQTCLTFEFPWQLTIFKHFPSPSLSFYMYMFSYYKIYVYVFLLHNLCICFPITPLLIVTSFSSKYTSFSILL